MERNLRLERLYGRSWVPMERELETQFNSSYRRIWIQATRLGTIQLTLFPVGIHQDYRFITEKNFGEITIERIRDLIMRNP